MKIIIAGDFCPQNRVSASFEKGDFQSVLGDIKDTISAADYSIVNFECPIVNGGEKNITKCGPALSCTLMGMKAVKWGGFNCVTLANNHFRDYGGQGVKSTIEACTSLGIDFVGGGDNCYTASRTLYKQIGQECLAIINCCEKEFSIASDIRGGSNPLNPINQYYAIQEAKKVANYVLVIIHGGHEHYQYPTPRMQDTYRFFVDAGADAVVNHHQHCFSGYELYHGIPIFYGLGNFCFDTGNFYSDLWNTGFMVALRFGSKGTLFDIIPYKQCDNTAAVKLLQLSEVENKINMLNSIIQSRDLLKEETEKYYRDSIGDVTAVIEPPFGKIGKLFKAAQSRGYLPSFVSRKWAVRLFDYIMCEAHRDKVEYFLNSKFSD